jgi:hypothetical protein
MRANIFVLTLAVLLGSIASGAAQSGTLTITPSTVVLPLGGAQRLELRDASGAVVSGAEWTVDTSGIVSLSTTPIVTIAAISPGEVTVTAAVSGETVEATVTVLTATEAPPGTPLWSLQRATPDNGAPISVLSAQNDDGVGADLFVIESSSADAIIRGVRSDGTEAWRRSLASESGIGPALADANGGVIVTVTPSAVYPDGCDLVRVDGDTGFESWRVSRSRCFVAKPALLPSGILVVAVWDGWDQYVLGVQAATGSIEFETPVGGASGGWGSPDPMGCPK